MWACSWCTLGNHDELLSECVSDPTTSSAMLTPKHPFTPSMDPIPSEKGWEKANVGWWLIMLAARQRCRWRMQVSDMALALEDTRGVSSGQSFTWRGYMGTAGFDTNWQLPRLLGERCNEYFKPYRASISTLHNAQQWPALRDRLELNLN